MKKYLLTLAAALCCTFAALSTSSAQTALFLYNDGDGTPDAGTVIAGSSFSFSISLQFAPGGSVTDLEGLSYWLKQQNPPGSPFNFAITLRDVTGSQFTDLQTPSPSYPQSLSPQNASDLGALLPGNTGVGANTYLIANVTIYVAPSAAYGDYLIGNTTTGGTQSVITDDQGHTFAIPQALYDIDVVPEPATWFVGGLTFVALAFHQRRRITRLIFSRS